MICALAVFVPARQTFTPLSSQGIATLIGIPLGEENQQKDFSYSVTLFEEKCLPKPKLLLYDSVIPLVAILLTLIVMALMAAKVAQLRLLVCERFFSAAAEARVEHLHAKILRKRLKQRPRCPTSPYLKVGITVNKPLGINYVHLSIVYH